MLNDLNLVHNCDFLQNSLPDKSVQLIIADPPYFEVKGDFDFIWASRDEYLADVEKWAKECKRVLADNGTLFWWGHAKKIAYAQVVFDRYFNLENSLVWEKSDCQTKRCAPESMRTFAPITERLLMYSNEIDVTGLQVIYSNINCFNSIKEYMRHERKILMNKYGFDTIAKFDKFINEWTGTNSVVSRHYFADSQYHFPTKKIYTRMQQTGFFQKPYEELRKEYEELHKEYEALRRPFDNCGILQSDILKYDQETHITKKYDHPTKKPEKLTRALITTCSRPNDIVLVPFAGSGTECAMAALEGRRFVGYDIEQKYVEMANNRCAPYLSQKSIF